MEVQPHCNERRTALGALEDGTITFHGLTHTAITHWAVAGKSQLFLLSVAGHMDVAMTKKYLGKAASVGAKFGAPHPPLAPSLLAGAKVST